eukprot:1185329-Prorocentrum_minimum.AAC.2
MSRSSTRVHSILVGVIGLGRNGAQVESPLQYVTHMFTAWIINACALRLTAFRQPRPGGRHS